MDNEIIKILGSGGALTGIITICFKVISKLYSDIRADRIDLMNFLREQNIINAKVSVSLDRITKDVCDIKSKICKGDKNA